MNIEKEITIMKRRVETLEREILGAVTTEFKTDAPPGWIDPLHAENGWYWRRDPRGFINGICEVNDDNPGMVVLLHESGVTLKKIKEPEL